MTMHFAKNPLSGLILAFVVAVAVSFFYVQPRFLDEKHKVSARLEAELIQLLVNQNIKNLQIHAGTLARYLALSGIFDPMKAENSGTLAVRWEDHLSTGFPDLIKARIFPLNQAVLDREGSPPFSFSSLDLVKRSETTGTQIIEAIKPGDRWLVTIASPIRVSTDQPVLGTLFIYLRPMTIIKGLEERFSQADPARIQIIQSFSGDSDSDFLTLGHQDKTSNPITRTLNLPGWQLHYSTASGYQTASIQSLLASIQSLLARPDIALLLALPSLLFLVIGGISVVIGVRKIEPVIKVGTAAKSVKSQGVSHSNTPSDPSSADKNPALAEAPTNRSVSGKKAGSIQQIFRANDIRGIVSQSLTPEMIKQIGLAIGSEAIDQGEQKILVACDGRISSPAVTVTLTEGLREAGIDVISIGDVPTPLMYFATHKTQVTSGVMVTGSHNPPDYNGFKIVINGKPLMDEGIQNLYRRITQKKFASGQGNLSDLDIVDDYINTVRDRVSIKEPFRIVVDCGNGIAGRIVPDLYKALGCEVIPLYCEVDGNFPNHPPDPTIPVNLEDLIMTVRSEKVRLGLALDGDGDRLIAVTAEGQIVWPDQLLMLFAKDIIPRNPGSKVIYDVKCTRQLENLIKGLGGRPVMAKSGHSFLKQKMMETDAILGGEFSGHICIKENWFGFDDGVYAGARLLEIVSHESKSFEHLLDEFQTGVATPEILVRLDEQTKFQVVEAFKKNLNVSNAKLIDLDGVRLDFEDGWGLVRASNTSPAITLRFEADNRENLNKIRQFFKTRLQEIDATITF